MHYFDLVDGVAEKRKVVVEADDAHVEVVNRLSILQDDVVEVAP